MINIPQQISTFFNHLSTSLRSITIEDATASGDFSLVTFSFSKEKVTGVIAVVAASMLLATTTATAEKPNIILIMADDLGYRELGSYGQTKIRTPHLDHMAAQGMRFTQFYSGSAVCAPSRCNLMTGKHAGHAIVRSNFEVKDPDPGVFGGQLPLPKDELTIAETLKAQGYSTGCFGKWGLGRAESTGGPLNKGFDRFYGYNCQRHAHNLYPRYLESDMEREILPGNTRGQTGETYAPQRIADEMLKFVRENKDQPFFAYYPTVIPHLALQAPEEDIAAYRGQWDDPPYKGNRYQHHDTPKACYAAMITFLDKQVGRLFALLKELDIDDNTIVLFTSDNGTTHLKDQVDYDFFESVGPLNGLKGSLYEGGVRVPLVAWWPGKIAAGTQSDHIAIHYDMPATIAQLAGTKFNTNHDGISIVPTLLGQPSQKAPSQKVHDYLFWDFAGYGGQLALRMGKWKGIKRDLKKNPGAPLELYNLEADIGEQHDIADQHPDVVQQIETILLEDRTRPDFKRFQFGEYGK
jgi:arylsulfatase